MVTAWLIVFCIGPHLLAQLPPLTVEKLADVAPQFKSCSLSIRICPRHGPPDYESDLLVTLPKPLRTSALVGARQAANRESCLALAEFDFEIRFTSVASNGPVLFGMHCR